LLTHYHLLLTNGKDTRKEGLVWIIKAIWNLGYNAIISFMPNYLDEKCIKFLFKYAQIEIEAEKIRHEIDKVKFNVKLYYQANQFEVQTKMKKKESFGAKDNTRNLIKKAQEEILLDDNKFNYKLIKDMVLKDGSFDDKTKVYIQNLSELETKLNQKRDELYSLQQKELNRLNKEFLFNDYSRRYNIDQHSLIASIVGQDFAASEYSQRQREQREVHSKINMCRTFNFIKKNEKNSTNFKINLEKISRNNKFQPNNSIKALTNRSPNFQFLTQEN